MKYTYFAIFISIIKIVLINLTLTSFAYSNNIQFSVGDDNKLKIKYSLDANVQSFTFNINNETLNEFRKRYWALEEGYKIENGIISSKGGLFFKDFFILVDSNYLRIDRQYQHFNKLSNDSYVFYIPYFLGKENTYSDVEIIYTNNIKSESLKPESLNGYYLYEKKEKKNTSNINFFSDQERNSDKQFERNVVAYVGNILDDLEDKFTYGLSISPTIIINNMPNDSRSGYHADVSKNSTVYVRLYGPLWSNTETDLLVEVQNILAHELFHLWNGALYVQDSANFSPWLSEGIAEYSAYRYLIENDYISKGSALERLNKNLNSCKSSLNNNTISSVTSGTTPYTCGFTLNYLLDLALLDKNTTIYEFWELVFLNSENSSYSTDDFVLKYYSANIVDDVYKIFHSNNNNRWEEINTYLNSHGIESKLLIDESLFRRTLLMNILDSNCPNKVRGYTEYDNYIVFDTSECLFIQNNIEINRVGDFHLFSQNELSYNESSQICEEYGIINLLDRRNQLYEVRCDNITESSPNQLINITSVLDSYILPTR